MRASLLDNLDTVRTLGWDRLVAPGDLLHCAAWLDINARTAETPPRYAVVQDAADATLLAGLPCYPQTRNCAPFSFLRPDVFIGRIAANRSLPMDQSLTDSLIKLLPSLVCGQRRGAESRLILARDLSDEQRKRAAGLALAAAEQSARQDNAASVALLFVPEDDTVVRRALEERGYVSFPGDTQALMDVPHGGLDAYLAQLSTARRGAVRRERRRVAGAGVTYRVVPAERANIDVLLTLEGRLLTKHGQPMEPSALEAMHVEVADALPGQVDYLVAEAEGQTVGFLQTIRKDDVLHPRSVGFDYDFRPELPLYFDLVYYETLCYAAERGLRQIDYSVEAEDVKASRGCRMRPLHTYLKPLTPEAGAVAKAVRELFDDV
ncbi:GNAT family N-acetyltransferase [Streptomyces sp. SID4928]|uniref:GNAT family N-acetyltransferase n=1 Tax=unclassified Streptomyces TaxID=2593676 RepID=UPI0001C19C2D|nr:GNAT family N-acetyltransferase [Streptomyces sp. ACT-1]EGE39613.1 protein of unknown function DUF482 [Streptomyces sp. ACT-1]MYR47702.1 GNAT family N-acetyltransferase [Streptomyces sp. SID4928]